MLKLIDPNNNSHGDQVAQLVPVGRSGIDRDWLTKRASARLDRFRDLRPKTANHSLIHVIAMSAMDAMGPNRNGDGWPESKYAIALDPKEAAWTSMTTRNGHRRVKSAATFTDRIHSGLIETHGTFLKGAVYRDHKNQPAKGDKRHGDVRAVEYDKPMKRVELLMEVDHTDPDWTKDVADVEAGRPIPLSMAANVKHDVCHACGNIAHHRGEYCEHAANQLGQLMAGGKIACVVNEKPDFFDISRVGRQADRVAFSLRKTANDGQATDLLTDYPDLQVPVEVLVQSQPMKVAARLQILNKLALMEKTIPAVGGSHRAATMIARHREAQKSDKLKSHEKNRDSFEGVATAMKAAQILLPAEPFARWIAGPAADPHLPAMKAAMVGIFGRAMNDNALEIAANDAYSTEQFGRLSLQYQKLAHELITEWGADAQTLATQAGLAALRGIDGETKEIKQASTVSATGQELANQYVSYLITTLSEFPKTAGFDAEAAYQVIVQATRC